MQLFNLRQINNSISGTNLNPLDEQKLDYWVNNNFMPYFMTFFIRTKQMSLGSPSRSEIINLANESELLISLLLWNNEYIKTNGDPSFSNAALNYRSEFINVQMQILRAEINDFMSTAGVLVQRKNVIRNIYRNESSFLNLNMPNRIAITVKQFGSNLQDDVISNDNTAGNQVTDDNNGSNSSSNTSTGSGITQNNGSKSGNLLLLALLGLGIYVVASSSTDEGDNTKGEKIMRKKS
jgi:hypothetical protein